MKFAGDSLICVFRPPDNNKTLPLSIICSNVVHCAMELAQICTEMFTIHVAVSCGPICFAMLGGHNNLWECLASGKCLGHMSQCLDDAASKQVVVSPDFVKMLGPCYASESSMVMLPSGNYRIISNDAISKPIPAKIVKKRREMQQQDCESRYL